MAHKARTTITKAEQSALKTLRADTSIVILPADKGRSTVVMDQADYIQKGNALLEDRQAYLPCNDEPMRKLVTQLDKTLADMQTSKTINKSLRLAIKPIDAAAPRFYGLPKVHKAGVPLRPKPEVSHLGRGHDGLFSDSVPGADQRDETYRRLGHGVIRRHFSFHIDSERPGSRNGQRAARESVRRDGRDDKTETSRPVAEILPEDVLYLRRYDLRAGQGDANGIAALGLHRKVSSSKSRDPSLRSL
nr:unnamed protein product [Spirometra erinaceieuropaei]